MARSPHSGRSLNLRGAWRVGGVQRALCGVSQGAFLRCSGAQLEGWLLLGSGCKEPARISAGLGGQLCRSVPVSPQVSCAGSMAELCSHGFQPLV